MGWATDGKPRHKPKPKYKTVSFDHDSESFVRGYQISEKLCDHLVANINRRDEFFNYDEKREYYRLQNKYIDKKLQQSYVSQVRGCLEQYEKDYQFARKGLPYTMQNPFNFQMYEPGCWYKHWHHEDPGPRPGHFLRKFVFMTYLNDIKEGGGTEFLYQDLDVEPKKGLTLIWPAGWTHPHRGVVAPEERKYIATGWFVYKDRIKE
jgi:hypothetical protein